MLFRVHFLVKVSNIHFLVGKDILIKKLEKVSMGHGCPRLLFLQCKVSKGFSKIVGGFVLTRYLISISFCSN